LAIALRIDFKALCPLEVGDVAFSVFVVITLFFLVLVYACFRAANAALSSFVPHAGRRRNWLAVQGIKGE
jgi:hypothetical protein